MRIWKVFAEPVTIYFLIRKSLTVEKFRDFCRLIENFSRETACAIAIEAMEE